MKACKIILIILIFHFRIAAQTSIKIILKTDKKIDSVDALDISQLEIYSTHYNDTITFDFKKSNIDCYNIRYHQKNKMYRQQIWLNPGKILIKAHIAAEEMVIDTVINSPFYYQSQKFFSSYSNILKTKDTIEINSFLLNVYKQNLQNPFSYLIGQNYIVRNQNSKPDLVKLKSLAEQQGTSFSWFLLYSWVIERVDNLLSSEKINMTAFTFIDRQNKKSKLVVKEGNYYLLDFWFLACAPCLRDHKEISIHLKKLEEKNIHVIGISIDEAERYSSWHKYLTKNKYTWENFMQQQKNKLTDKLGIGSCPAYVIVNSRGEIIASYNLFSDISKKYGLENE